MSDDDKLDRRQFLVRAGYAGLFAAGATSVAAGCKKGGGKSGSEGGGGSESQQQPDKGGGSAKLDCTDTSGLKNSEKKTRKSLKYTDSSPKDDKSCSNCQLFQPPKEDGSCGSCQSVPGPIHPDGYCTAWVKKA
ncbi:MAG: high-potential iron-sulfur protein [Bradymonadaceae bacterium]